MVVLGSEIGNAMTISSIGFRHTSGNAVVFDQFTVYMGAAVGGSLGSNFDENYAGGKTTVYDHTNASFTESGDWITIPLDTPYFYSGTGNLIIEIAWPNGDMEMYAGHWSTPGVNRVMTSFFGNPTGDAFEFCPNLKLTGTLSLAPMTFGSIKATFR